MNEALEQLAARANLPVAALEQIYTALAKEATVQRALLYGSRARGTARNTSDIDIALDGDTLSLAHKARLEQVLDDLLLPWKIDLCVLRDVDNADLLANIQQDGQLLYQRKSS
ncbi:MAG: nucleotidyltransferase domain-containing protein [Pseudomonadales bacterium]